MVKNILTASGLPFRRSHFHKPPEVTYAVYFDDVDVDGPDRVETLAAAGLPCIYHHDVSIEVYAPYPDDAAEAAVEVAMLAMGITTWHREDRYWLQDVQRYQTVYTFSYTAKK